MNLVRHVATATIVLVAAAAPALAQPGTEAPTEAQPQPPPPAEGTIVTITPDGGQGQASAQPPVRAVVAPMNEDWQNVNHINGQIVKVGERGEYLMKYKKTNVSSNPIGWMFGFYGVSVSHAVSPHIVIRGDANWIDVDHESGYELGLTVPIYFKRAYQGPFLEGGIMVRSINDKEDDGCFDCMKDSPNVGPQMMFGWSWLFDSGANVAFAFGAFRPMNDGKTQDDVEPAGYFRIGYAY